MSHHPGSHIAPTSSAFSPATFSPHPFLALPRGPPSHRVVTPPPPPTSVADPHRVTGRESGIRSQLGHSQVTTGSQSGHIWVTVGSHLRYGESRSCHICLRVESCWRHTPGFLARRSAAVTPNSSQRCRIRRHGVTFSAHYRGQPPQRIGVRLALHCWFCCDAALLGQNHRWATVGLC